MYKMSCNTFNETVVAVENMYSVWELRIIVLLVTSYATKFIQDVKNKAVQQVFSINSIANEKYSLHYSSFMATDNLTIFFPQRKVYRTLQSFGSISGR